MVKNPIDGITAFPQQGRAFEPLMRSIIQNDPQIRAASFQDFGPRPFFLRSPEGLERM
jgi:hypothetical protein